MIKIATLTFNPFGENSYVIYDEKGECLIVDAGCYTENEQRTLKNFIEKNGLKPVMALNTHAHIDHVCGVEFVKREWSIPFALHRDDRAIMEMVPLYASSMGFNISSVPTIEIDLAEQAEIKLGETLVRIIHTPGHTPGGVCIHLPSENILITGDTLFRESIGRTDLPGGDYEQLMNSILEKIVSLGDCDFFPGHGGKSTIAHELMFNPFISEVLQGEVNYKSNEN
ncbi:Hydroxyacylglutathione hydrolase [Mucinivorans hirudinis]|uniref:Hydroxyacylglutathione hydrolase n=1 Tax=Mucinivorans hirudinis TaxID=1433126 RepID=A0A060R9N7_9BACT|nr:Hydroxyacylglutathione hydrolase [Mucinivorans hirudinis]